MLSRHWTCAAVLALACGTAASGQCYQDRLAAVDLDPSAASGYGRTVFDGTTAVLGNLGNGVVNIVEFDGNGWSLVAVITGDDTLPQDRFGQAVGFSGSRIVVGAPQRDEGGENKIGAAYVFERIGGEWTQTAKLLASEPVEEDFFGEAVAIDGDRVVVSARRPQDGFKGAVYVFEHDGSGWLESAIVQPGGVEASDNFGRRLALWGDRLAASAPSDDDAGTNAGAIYIMDLIGGAWQSSAKLLPPGGAPLGAEDISWAWEPGRLVYCPGYPDEFSTYTFTYESGAWVAEWLPHPDPGDGTFFATPAMDGDVLTVTALDFFLNHETTYRYDRSGGQWTLSREYSIPVDGLAGEIALSVDHNPPVDDGNPDAAEIWDLCAPPCVADWNLDGLVDTRDVLAFINDWAAGDASADVNGDGVVDTEDVSAFLNLWTAGC